MLDLKVVILTSDKRDHDRNYSAPHVYFGTAPEGLLQGFAGLWESRKPETGDRESRGDSFQGSGPNPQLSKFEIHVVSCTQQPMRSPEKLAENIWFHSLHVPKWGWLKTGYLGCILAVRKKLREIQPDIVHAQGTERDCAISAIFSPYPKLLTIHGNLRLIRRTVGFRPFSALWFQSFIEGLVVPRFDGIVCITSYTRQAVQHEAKKTWVVPNAVDPTFLELGEAREQEKGKSGDRGSAEMPPLPVILVVATIEARKNQNALILALDSLAAAHSFKLRFFGHCGDHEYALAFRRLLETRPWCEYGGMIGRDRLREQFLGATLLVLPTHEDNCPMVVLEAMAAGLPIVASNVGGIPDLIEDGVNGLMVDPERPETMGLAVEKILRDPALADRLAKNGISEASRRFHPRVIARKHLEIYRETLAS